MSNKTSHYHKNFKLTPAHEAELMDNNKWYWDIPQYHQWNAPRGIAWEWHDIKEIYEYHCGHRNK